MKTSYNLSYNNQAMLEEILSDISFPAEFYARAFIVWFNNVLNANARVNMTSVCEKMGIDIPSDKKDVFDMVGFNQPMSSDHDVIHSVSGTYLLVFPWLVDFKQKGVD